jgi:hypothetical protein
MKKQGIKEKIMKNKKQVLLMGMIVCLVVIPMAVLAQPSRIIGGTQADHANAIVRSITPPNGYVMAGWTRRLIAGTSNTTMDALVVRVNAYGVPIPVGPNNAVIAGGAQDEEATSMVRTSDQFYVVTGWTRSYNNTVNTNADVFVIKFYSNLTVRWAKVYHMTTNDLGHRANSIIEVTAPNGTTKGYILTGYLLSPNTATHRILVIRLDVDGNVTWVRTYGTGNNLYNEGFSITEVRDSMATNVKFAVVGRTAATMTAQGDAFIMRLDSNGIVTNPTCVFNGNYDDHARSVVWDGQVQVPGQAPGFMVAGMTKSTSPGSPTPANIWVARIRANNGSVDWANVYKWDTTTGDGPDRIDYIQGDKALIVASGNADSGFVLSGITYSRGPNAVNAPNVLLIRLKPDGSVDWNGKATVHPSLTSSNNFDIANGVVQSTAIPSLNLPGDGFAVAGWSNSFNPNPPSSLAGHNILFTTFAKDGTRPSSCAVHFKMMPSTLSTWTTRNFNYPLNYMSKHDMSVSNCTVDSKDICYVYVEK